MGIRICKNLKSFSSYWSSNKGISLFKKNNLLKICGLLNQRRVISKKVRFFMSWVRFYGLLIVI